MHLAVFGASGRTGSQVVSQGLDRGFSVTAVARRRSPDSFEAVQLRRAVADVESVQQVTQALADVDAVVSAIGIGTSRAPTTTYSNGVTNVLAGMAARGISRIVVVSAGAAGPRAEQARFNRFVVMPILERVYGASYADMRRMEAVLERSESNWVALRPPRLVEKPEKGGYRLDRAPLPGGRAISIPDLAAALLDTVVASDLHRRGVYVSN